MELKGMFTAVSADFTNDVLNVQGGMWNALRASSFPAEQRIVVVGLVHVSPEDVGVDHHVDLEVFGPTGRVGQVHGDVNVHQDRGQVPIILTVPAVMPVAGEHRIVLTTAFGKQELTFQLTGPETGIQTAVDAYALGLGRRR